MKKQSLSERVGMGIHLLRVQHQMTQKQFAQAIEVSERSVNRWENGQGYPTWSALEKIEKKFKCNIGIFANRLSND